MINSLTIKNIASYTNGVTISDLKKVNFFFGFNGTGKSTISSYLKNLCGEENQNPFFCECSNVGYDSSQHQILVFNEEFIEENFRRSADFKGVFSLNQTNESIDRQIEAQELKNQNYESIKNRCLRRIELIENDKKAKSRILTDHCWDQRSAFSTFSNISLEHKGSKPNHLRKIRSILQNPPTQILNIQELTEQYKAIYESNLQEITKTVNVRTYRVIRRLEIEINKVLNEVIIGNEDVDIAGLIDSLNSRKWVEDGTKLLHPTDSTCPFCQKQTIDSNLRDQFDKYFDETYKNKIAEIERIRDQYAQITRSFINNINEIQNLFNPNNIVSNLILSLTSLFGENIKIINYKIDNSNERKKIVSLNTQKETLSNIISQIKDNNQRYDSLDSSKKNLVKHIWNNLAESCKQKIQEYDGRLLKYSRIVTKLDEKKTSCATNISVVKQDIETLRSQTVNTKDAVDNINFILKNAGFEGFEIDEKDTTNNISRYYLKRPNNSNESAVFKSLSEGEKNFISFLYFYQLCIGTDDLQNNSGKKKIIVIDDPVSSLDSQALFIVSTLIHSLIQRKSNDTRQDRKTFYNGTISQVFILTHNLYFYKEVSFDKRPMCTDYWHFKVSKLNNQTTITGDYNRRVYDDYSLMWQTIKDIKANSTNDSSLNIMISNSMRRIIESYVNFVGYGRDSWGALINEDQNDPHYYIKCSFISTINDESHKISALDNAYYQKIINEQPQVLFTVFASVFKSIGKEHYEMMMDEQLDP